MKNFAGQVRDVRTLHIEAFICHVRPIYNKIIRFRVGILIAKISVLSFYAALLSSSVIYGDAPEFNITIT